MDEIRRLLRSKQQRAWWEVALDSVMAGLLLASGIWEPRLPQWLSTALGVGGAGMGWVAWQWYQDAQKLGAVLRVMGEERKRD